MKTIQLTILLIVFLSSLSGNTAEALKYQLKNESPLKLVKPDGRYWLNFKGEILLKAKYKIIYSKGADFGEEVQVTLYPSSESQELLPKINERGKLEEVQSISLSHLNAPHYDILGDKLAEEIESGRVPGFEGEVEIVVKDLSLGIECDNVHATALSVIVKSKTDTPMKLATNRLSKC